MFITTSLNAQNFSISGKVKTLETQVEIPLQGANIQLFSLPDSSFVTGTSTAESGEFLIINMKPAKYLLIISYLGYASQSKEVEINDVNIAGLEFLLQPTALELGEFHVLARRPRVDVRGDTTAYHADGYRTNRDANVQDLVTRMPGFMIEDGRLQAQGEEVASVLVDGEEFFGEDAALTLQNLPAEIVAQIEVFDRQSDQAEFTGFRDGNTRRTINIITREGMNQGQFGRANSGYGSQTRYMAGGNYNYFSGSQRMSLIGMSNNVNQQNFSSEDLLGISEAGGGGGRGGRGGNRDTRNFMAGNQSGISSVNSTGVNYIDRWNDSWRINASYFFNMSDNTHDLTRERRYLTGFSADQLYDEDAFNTSDNYNHRFNMRLEHTIDDRRSFIFTPSLSFQRNNSMRTVDGFTMDQNRLMLNEILRENRSDQTGYNISNNLLYRHRFETGRTFSANLRTNFNDRNGARYQFDESVYYDETGNTILNDQQIDIITGGYNLSGNLSVTQPVTEKTQLLISYQPSFSNNESIQDVFRFDDFTGTYSMIDTTLTNRYHNQIFSNRVRGSYRFRGEQYNANISLSWQQTTLDGEQTFPQQAGIEQSWQNILPDAFIQYRFGRRSNIRLSYGTETRTPSVRQLQDVIDNSDPMRMSTGNPDLNQQFGHNISLRVRHANTEKGSSVSAFVSMNFTEDFIGNRTFVAQQDTLLQKGVILGRGSRLTSPDNIGSSRSFRSNLNRSMPVDFLQSNLSLNGGIMFTRRPSYIDNERNLTDNIRFNTGLTVSSNISERVDFRFAYNANYNIVENSVRPELNNNYYAGRASGSFNLMPWKGLVLASDFNLRHYEGLGNDYNQSTIYWNGSLGYKFLENEAAEIRTTLFDILGQNDNVSRIISDDYIEDYRSNVLTRYFILTFSYNFRSFAGG